MDTILLGERYLKGYNKEESLEVEWIKMDKKDKEISTLRKVGLIFSILSSVVSVLVMILRLTNNNKKN